MQVDLRSNYHNNLWTYRGKFGQFECAWKFAYILHLVRRRLVHTACTPYIQIGHEKSFIGLYVEGTTSSTELWMPMLYYVWGTSLLLLISRCEKWRCQTAYLFRDPSSPALPHFYKITYFSARFRVRAVLFAVIFISRKNVVHFGWGARGNSGIIRCVSHCLISLLSEFGRLPHLDGLYFGSELLICKLCATEVT